MTAKLSSGIRFRRWVGNQLINALFRSVSAAARLHPKARLSSHGVEKLSNLAYTDSGDKHHRLDVYRPVERRGPLPVVLFVHGGSFRLFSKDVHWLMGLQFARYGAVVFSINYRLAPGHRFPSGVEDAANALLWVQKHAHEYGGDPEQLILAGESAGGNLVSTLALQRSHSIETPWSQAIFEANPSIKAVIPGCAALQVTKMKRYLEGQQHSLIVRDRLQELERAYLPPTGVPEGMKYLADPLLFFESEAEIERPLPPFFLFAGTADPILNDTERMEAALKKRGVDCEARYYEKGVHSFHALIFQKIAQDCWRDQFAFLDRVLDSDSNEELV